ncbi:ATP-dependent DNA helicase RecG [Sulfurimonas sp. HSL-3221]|uniref:ATP-dependent DNA helicase RecG n=1 Tax=Sulfurimonadaceae TaxID=2771471 RepID=UPI001E2E4409|nr:ATP-dependent DNA helicase RecG [Sulfurimonas sp. HSL-3221]UFS62095.1 ATP-dependent DNA helicase RecG [Sulfurimonas sp. HSL-3221]
MQIEQADIEKFKKLGVYSAAELAIHTPVRFEDRRLYPRLKEGTEQAIDATVESIHRSPRTVTISLYVHNFGHRIEGVLFNPKPYMLRFFTEGERTFFFGRIDCRQGRCQMSHPQRIPEAGTLTPKYKTSLRTDVMARLAARYITRKNLLDEGLPPAVADALLGLHFPKEAPLKEPTPQQLYALKYTELYSYMRSLQGKRRYFHALKKLENDWRGWAMRLPFLLTGEQTKAIEAIETDFKKPHAAKRMVVGDVGAGKTMVILAAMQMASPHRSILMAPTTILANQLYEEARKFLPEKKILLITNATPKKMPLGEADVLIGTHALLYRNLPEAALIMVDEQHRFGTAQRHRLEKLLSEGTRHPHYLQFSATPIPRTQAMIDSAHIDVSLITKTPFKKDISTAVIHKPDFPALLQHIRAEIAQEHQVLIVYPLVEESENFGYQSIEEARGYWEKHFKNVYVTHGKDKEKEAILETFREQGDILLATTVIEVGISLPRLTTVVIVGAERLGLATLHQLRGRVSRTGLKGWCFLYTNLGESERLDAFRQTDNGFDIAALDLKYRKSGDLLKGSIQSGKKFLWADLAEDEAIVREVKAALSHL